MVEGSQPFGGAFSAGSALVKKSFGGAEPLEETHRVVVRPAGVSTPQPCGGR